MRVIHAELLGKEEPTHEETMQVANASSARRKISVMVVVGNHMECQLLSDVLGRDERLDVFEKNSLVAGEIELTPDVALVSSVVNGQSGKGFDVARELSHNKGTRVVMLVDEATPEVVLNSFRAGARGVFSRTDSPKLLVKCISSVHAGQIWASNSEVECLLSAVGQSSPPNRILDAKGNAILSNREQDVVRWVTEGLTNKEIALRLGLSEHTIKNYLFRIFDKLGISTRVELILYSLTQLSSDCTLGQPFANEMTTFNWLREAADRGLFSAYSLAECYSTGRGIGIDKATAYMWFVIAEATAKLVHQKSVAARLSLDQELSPEQIHNAKCKANQWLVEKESAWSHCPPPQHVPQQLRHKN